MKIAMIGQKAIPAVSGGVERHVEELSRRLVSRGHSVTVYNRRGYAAAGQKNYAGIRLKEIFTIGSKSLEAPLYSFLAAIDAAAGDYDIVHFHALGPAAVSFIPRIFRKKIIVTIHGLDWQRSKWGRLARLYLKFGEKASVWFSNRTVAVSKSLKHYIENKYGKECIYIPNGVTIPETRDAKLITTIYGLQKNEYILFLSRLVPEKGCHYLINAFKSVNKGIKLVIAGGSSYTSSYCSGLLRHSSPDIIFTGEVRGSLLEELFSNALFYILPSEIEGLPISLLEAMSYGLCPLVSDIPENLEVISGEEMCGFSFHTKDAGSLKDMLEYMLSKPVEVAKKGGFAKELVKSRYNWDEIATRTEELYKSVLLQA